MSVDLVLYLLTCAALAAWFHFAMSGLAEAVAEDFDAADEALTYLNQLIDLQQGRIARLELRLLGHVCEDAPPVAPKEDKA